MKKILSVLCIVVIMLSGAGCDKSSSDSNKEISGTDTGLTSRLENSIELQKNLFVGKVTSVHTENALIAKYNIDITEYTVYNVTVTHSLDGITPLGDVKVYCVGTVNEFPNRIGMSKNETYFIDAQPWVYGDEIIYLLSIYTVAYPRVDIANNVTLETEDGKLLDCGTFDEYVSTYNTAYSNVSSRIEGFSDLKATADRILSIIEEIKTKNTNVDFYHDSEMGFDWTPTDEFINTTADNSEKLYNEAKRVADLETVTKEDLTALFNYFK